MRERRTDEIRKRTIVVRFDLQARVNGKLCPYKEMKLKTKPVTLKRAHQIAKKEALSVWPNFEYEIR